MSFRFLSILLSVDSANINNFNLSIVKNKITSVLTDSLHYIYDASFIFSVWRVPLTEGEHMNAPTVFTKEN